MIVTAGLLIVHTLGLSAITVDTTSLVLLGIILLCPWLAALKRIKIGEFEAEIDSAEVKRLTTDVNKALPELEGGTAVPPRERPIIDAARQLAVTDPVLSLAKLRIELERILRRLHGSVSQTPSPKNPSLSWIIRDLTAREMVPSELAASIRDVLSICNRAIHGEEIRPQDAVSVVDSVGELLDALDTLAREYAATHPLKREDISLSDVEGYQHSRYRLTTIIPYVENPQKLTYVLTHDELEEFFDGYEEFAEFVVSIERISDGSAA